MHGLTALAQTIRQTRLRSIVINETFTYDYVESSGNVFTDMGLEDADERLTRAQIGSSVQQILKLPTIVGYSMR